MSSLNNFIFQLHEHWLSNGPPAETFGKAGDFFKSMEKSVTMDWQGTGNGKLPVRSSLDGNVGNVFSNVIANATGTSGEQFDVPSAEFWVAYRPTTKFLAFTKNPQYLESGMSGTLDEMEQKAASWMRGMSYVLWGNGKAVYGKGDGLYSVAGSVITLRNKASARCFEQNDKIRLVLEATESSTDPGNKATPEAGELTVVSVNTDAGTLTVAETINVAIPTATNTAWITKSAYHGSSARHPTGVFGFLAENQTEAVKTFYGVDRSVNPNRLAGHRIGLTGSESPWSICAKIMSKAREEGAAIDQIWVPSSEVEALIDEMGARNIKCSDVTVSITNPSNLVIGVSATKVVYGSMEVTLLDDRFMIDHGALSGEDKRYVGLRSGDCRIATADGVGWKDYDGDGTMLVRDAGTQTLTAEYGMFGEYVCRDTNNQIVASPTAED